MADRRKPRHVDADLGHDHMRCGVAHPGTADELLGGGPKGRQRRSDLRLERADLLAQVVDHQQVSTKRGQVHSSFLRNYAGRSRSDTDPLSQRRRHVMSVVILVSTSRFPASIACVAGRTGHSPTHYAEIFIDVGSWRNGPVFFRRLAAGARHIVQIWSLCIAVDMWTSGEHLAHPSGVRKC